MRYEKLCLFFNSIKNEKRKNVNMLTEINFKVKAIELKVV